MWFKARENGSVEKRWELIWWQRRGTASPVHVAAPWEFNWISWSRTAVVKCEQEHSCTRASHHGNSLKLSFRRRRRQRSPQVLLLLLLILQLSVLQTPYNNRADTNFFWARILRTDSEQKLPICLHRRNLPTTFRGNMQVYVAVIFICGVSGESKLSFKRHPLCWASHYHWYQHSSL